jgi:Xaa-Pro aminopeptidase
MLSALFLILWVNAWSDDHKTPAPETPGPEAFKQRRLALLDSLGDGMAVLYSNGTSGEMGYRADGDFWYLTGLDDPGAILLLAPREKYRTVLLLAPRDQEQERWVGERAALTESLKTALKVDEVNRTSALDWWVMSGIGHSRILHLISRPALPSAEIPSDMVLYNKVTERMPEVTVKNSSRFLESMRTRKDADEMAALERAIEITFKGLTESTKLMKAGVTEFQLAGRLEESFRSQGAQYLSFPPIVGSGRHSTVLHYERLDKEIQSGELVLIDCGAEWNHYAADVTRTFPVDGKFTELQAKVYDVVWEAQKAAIAAIKPGITMDSVDAIARDVIRKAGYADAFIHGTSHFLGVEVHDVGDYWQQLKPGMVITVEPGVYLPEAKIGVRIEDDVLVTQNGHRVLSAGIPKERKDIELWMAEVRR